MITWGTHGVTAGTRQNTGTWGDTESRGSHGAVGGHEGPGGSQRIPAAGLTSGCRAVTSRRRWRVVTSRPRDESRCRDAAPGHAGPPRARPGDSGDSGSGGSGDSGDSGWRQPPFSASFCRGAPAEPPEPGRAGRRLWARCCAASPASGCAGAARCPPGRCPRPCRPRPAAACRRPPACPRAPSAATCRAPTAPTAACTAGRTWPATRSSSPSPSRAATAVPTCSTLW